MPNAFVHVELNTTDVAKAKTFYSKLFDWKLADVDMGGGNVYTTIDVGSGTGGGIMAHPMGGPSMWLSYAHVDEIEAATDKARGLGATIVREPMEVMDYGWLSILIDPTGAMLGLWQPKPRM